MGKKRLEKITRIANDNCRKVTICKRKKGLIKKCIELSVLCDMKIFMLIQEEENERVTHFTSHKDLDPIQIFNGLNQREFYCNADYERVGGNKHEIDSDLQNNSDHTLRIASDDE